MSTFFFSATRNAHKQHTALYDFVWPTATAMWNLRWQLEGYIKAVPNARIEQLNARFAEGADISGGNLKRACIEHSWEQQKESFARILLVNTIANYEGWIEGLLEEFGRNNKAMQQALQTTGPSGIIHALTQLTANKSQMMTTHVYPKLIQGRHYALQKLEAMMTCYRMFKELRNCGMHRGGVGDKRVQDAFNNFSTVASTAALGVSEVPKHFPIVLGAPIQLSLRGVVGFSHIVLKIMSSVDAELSQAVEAEKVFLARWRSKHGPRLTIPGDLARRKERLLRMARGAGVLPLTDFEGIGVWLKSIGLILY